MRNRLLLASGLTLGVLLLVSSSVKAENYNLSFNGGPGVTAAYDIGGDGTTSGNTAAGTFTVTDTGPSSPGIQFQAFCIDLWHHASSPFVGSATALGTTSQLNGLLATGYNPITLTPTLVNELNYLGTVYNAINTSLTGTAQTEAIGAVQLAIWSLIDQKVGSFNGFSFSGVGSGDSAMITDYVTIIKALGGTATTTSSSGSALFVNPGGNNGTPGTIGTAAITAYNTLNTYSGATFVQVASQNSGSSQNLLEFGTVTITSTVVPEPSSMAIAGLGALGMIGFGWKRRKRA